MSLYTGPDPDLERKVQEGKTALRWAALAFLFMAAAVIGQLVWFFFLITKNPNTMAAFVAMVGCFVLAEYCRWCAKDSKPEDWS